MAVSFDETLVGSIWQRADKASAIFVDLLADFGIGGTYEASMKAFEETLTGGGITVAGDRAKESDIAAGLADDFALFKAAAEAYGAAIQRRMRLVAMRNAWRDSVAFGAGPGPSGGGVVSGGGGVVSFDAYKATHQEIARQMLAAGLTVATCTPAVSAFSATSTNVGNGATISSVKRADGLTAELMFAETGTLYCVRSGYDDRGTRHHEEFEFLGRAGVGGHHPDWGTAYYGSNAKRRLRVIDPTANNSRGNLLVNGFETFSSNVPTGWQATTGTAGTDFQATASHSYFGSNCLELIGGTGVLTCLEQSFGAYNELYSTPAKLKGNTQYAVCIRLKADDVPASGAAVVELVGTGNTLNEADDDQGTDNTIAIDLTTLTTSWQNFTGVFRTPRNVADGTKIRFRLTAAVPASRFVRVDGFAKGEMTELYPGGPWIALVAGSTPFTSGHANVQRDSFTITTTNDNNSAASARRTYHRFCDSMWDLRLVEVLYPSTAGTEDIADSVL